MLDRKQVKGTDFYVNFTEACTVYSYFRLYTMKIEFKLTPNWSIMPLYGDKG